MYPKILKLNNKKINNSIKKQVKNLSRYINGGKWDITKYLLKWLKSKNSGNTKCWWGWGTTDIFIHCWLECKTVQPLWKLFGQLLTELNIVSTYDPAIILRHFSSWFENICQHKDLHLNVCSSFIQSNWKDIPNRLIDKQIVTCPYNRMLIVTSK